MAFNPVREEVCRHCYHGRSTHGAGGACLFESTVFEDMTDDEYDAYEEARVADEEREYGDPAQAAFDVLNDNLNAALEELRVEDEEFDDPEDARDVESVVVVPPQKS